MARRGTGITHQMPLLFVFLLIGLFAASALTLTLIGTRIYRSATAEAQLSSDTQILLSYMGNKVHAYDQAGGVAIATRGGQPALCLFETIDGAHYETAIYAAQGAVWERFATVGEPFDPEDGERLAQAASLTFSMPAPNLIQVSVTLQGGQQRVIRMALRTAAAKEGG